MFKKKGFAVVLVVTVLALTLFQPFVLSKSPAFSGIVTKITSFFGNQTVTRTVKYAYNPTSDSVIKSDPIEVLCQQAYAAELDSGSVTISMVSAELDSNDEYTVTVNYSAKDVADITIFSYDITGQVENNNYDETTPISYINQYSSDLNNGVIVFKLSRGTHTDLTSTNGYNDSSTIMVKMGGTNITEPATTVYAFSATAPTATPSAEPTATPSAEPTATPSAEPTATPSAEPTAMPTATPSAEPTATPSAEPTATPSAEPIATPSAEPTATPSAEPTATPSAEPTATPTAEPTAIPTATPSAEPTAIPTAIPTATPTATPTAEPTATPTAKPEFAYTINNVSQNGSDVTVNITRNDSLADYAMVVVATYNSNGALTSMKTQTIDINNLNVGIPTDVTVNGIDITSASSAKAFIWSSSDTIKPFGKEFIVK